MATTEENVSAATVEVSAATVEVPAADPLPLENTIAVAIPVAGEAKKKEVKPRAPRKPHVPSHPKYLEMISEAISSLKERMGSSQYAITKFIQDKHGVKLPPNFKKMVLVQLRKLTADGKLTKIKNSFKLPSSARHHPAKSSVAKPKSASTASKANAAAVKPKSKSKAKAKPAVASKPKSKTVAKTKSAMPSKPKAKLVVPKLKAKAPSVKVAKRRAMDTPSKKKPQAPAKKTPPAKVKSVKTPAKVKLVKTLAKKVGVPATKGKASQATKVLARKAKK